MTLDYLYIDKKLVTSLSMSLLPVNLGTTNFKEGMSLALSK